MLTLSRFKLKSPEGDIRLFQFQSSVSKMAPRRQNACRSSRAFLLFAKSQLHDYRDVLRFQPTTGSSTTEYVRYLLIIVYSSHCSYIAMGEVVPSLRCNPTNYTLRPFRIDCRPSDGANRSSSRVPAQVLEFTRPNLGGRIALIAQHSLLLSGSK